MTVLVFIGPSGAGKTRVGKRVARLLGVPFTDTDSLIAQEYGPLPEIFREFSEYRMIVYAVALILMMILRPQGLLGLKELWEVDWREVGRSTATAPVRLVKWCLALPRVVRRIVRRLPRQLWATITGRDLDDLDDDEAKS